MLISSVLLRMNLHLNNCFLNAFLGNLFGNPYQWCLFKSLKQFILADETFARFVTFRAILVLNAFYFISYSVHFTNVFSSILFPFYFSISKLKLPQ